MCQHPSSTLFPLIMVTVHKCVWILCVSLEAVIMTAVSLQTSVRVQLGRSSSVCVCMARAYSGISSSHISHNSVDMCVYVPRSGLWDHSGKSCRVVSLLFCLKSAWLSVLQPYMGQGLWWTLLSGCRKAADLQWYHLWHINILSVGDSFCSVFCTQVFPSLDVEGSKFVIPLSIVYLNSEKTN